MKKKLLSAALILALIAIMVSGTLAYFTASDKVTNTFTLGSVLIDIWENDEITDEDHVIFEKPLVPVVDDQDLANDPGYAKKEVKVQNTGNNAAYIRTHIAIPTALVEYLKLDLNTTGWTEQPSSTATVEDVAYTVYTYDYDEAVDPDAFTELLLKGAYLASDVDIKNNPATDSADLEFCKPDGNNGYTFSGFVAHKKVTDGYTSNTVCILVASQAIQAQGFESVGATEALNSGFPANPWQ